MERIDNGRGVEEKSSNIRRNDVGTQSCKIDTVPFDKGVLAAMIPMWLESLTYDVLMMRHNDAYQLYCRRVLY